MNSYLVVGDGKELQLRECIVKNLRTPTGEKNESEDPLEMTMVTRTIWKVKSPNQKNLCNASANDK